MKWEDDGKWDEDALLKATAYRRAKATAKAARRRPLAHTMQPNTGVKAVAWHDECGHGIFVIDEIEIVIAYSAREYGDRQRNRSKD